MLQTVGFSEGKDALRRKLQEVARDPAFPMTGKGKDSGIYDALKEGVQILGNPSSADSLLVITDGLDEGSKSRPNEILDLLSRPVVRIFSILVDPVSGQRSSIDPNGFVRLVQKSGGKVFGPIVAENPAFQNSKKGVEIRKDMEEQLVRFYSGILGNDVLTIHVSSTIQKPEAVGLSLTDSARRQIKKAQVFSPHEIGPCSDIGASR